MNPIISHSAGNKAALFVGTTKSGGLTHFDHIFLDTAHSFSPLTAKDKLLDQPIRLYVVRTKTGDRFASLAKHSAIANYPEYQLRLLNNHFPSGEPYPGDKIKVVR